MKYPDGQFASLARNRIKSLEVTKSVEQSPTSVNSGAAEIAFWDSVKHSTNPNDFRLYLKNYPDGAFADLATSRVNSLEAASESAKREVFRGFRVNIGYRNKDGVNRLDVANKIAERLRSLGAEVGVYENNWKNWNGKLFFSSPSDAQTAAKIAESIADLVTANPIPAPDKSVKDKHFSLWLQ